jgi:hypothetical protein
VEIFNVEFLLSYIFLPYLQTVFQWCRYTRPDTHTHTHTNILFNTIKAYLFLPYFTEEETKKQTGTGEETLGELNFGPGLSDSRILFQLHSFLGSW